MLGTVMAMFCKMFAMGIVGVLVGVWIAFCARKDDERKVHFTDNELKTVLWMAQNTYNDQVKNGEGDSVTAKYVKAIAEKAGAELAVRNGAKERRLCIKHKR